MCEFEVSVLLRPAGMAAFSSAMQQGEFGSAADRRAASARSKILTLPVWALCRRSLQSGPVAF